MKILNLTLRAFGPFSGAVLDLSQGRQGLHLVYGPNEAGKSASLRAVGNLLYGIPVRSPDKFLHPYTKMRVGAILRHSDGSELELVRRKGNRNTLRGADDSTPLDDAVLDRFLAGVDEDLFRTMFGIDHHALRRGGQEIVRGGGRIGEILFAAGSGVADLRQVQESLQSETDALFKPTGRNQKINQAVRLLLEARTELKGLQLSSDEWSRHQQSLKKAQERRESLEGDLRQNRQEQNRLGRIRDALPAIFRWRQLQGQFEPYKDATPLPEDFGQRRGDVLTQRQIAQTGRDEARQAIERVDDELRTLTVSEDVLEQAEAIEGLRERLGSHRKAMGDLPRLTTSKEIAERDAREILEKLGRPAALDQAKGMRLPADKAVLIQNLGSRQQALAEKFGAARKQRDRIGRRVSETEKKLVDLDAVADTTQLRQIVRRIRQQGDIEQARSEAVDALEKIEQHSGVRLAQLGLWSGSLDELERLSVPSDETVDRFDQQIRDLDVHLAGLRDRRAAEEEAVDEFQTKLRELELGQAIPTEEDLDAARQRRQQGWRLVRRALEEGRREGPDVEAFLESLDAADLADAYERCVDQADELADRLRREADRVAGKAKLQADRDRAQKRCEALDEEIRAAEDDAARLGDHWTGLWPPLGIAPRPPREMRSWLRRHSELVDLAADARKHRAQIERQAKQIDAERRLLADCLKSFGADTDPGETLAAMVDRAEVLIDHAAQQQATWDRLRQTLDDLRSDLENAEAEQKESRQELAAWQGEWAAAVRHLGLSEDVTAPEANEVISTVKDLFDKLHDADQLGLRIRGIDHDNQQFAGDVRAMAERLAPELAGRPVEDAVAAISSKLTEARAVREKRRSLSQQRTRHEETVAQAEAAISTADAQLSAMCEQAGCRRHEELPEAQRRSDRRRELESELEAAESEILSHSAGTPLRDFVEQAQAVDADVLESQIEELDERIHRLEQELTEANQQIGSERTRLAAMDGNPRAAEKAEACENLAAQLDEDVRDYAVLRLASAVLREAVERYREKNQGPILDRAGQLFAEVTGGSFEGLRTDFDAQGEPVLMGVRAGTTETIGPEAMSDGSCDQLYLALRIASIENWLESHEPIPFIVDDVLLNFDNARAAATLGALADLSRRTQVVFFTHHEHLVAMAQDRVADDTLFTHRL